MNLISCVNHQMKIPLRHLGVLAFHWPSCLHIRASSPSSVYPALQLNLWRDPCIQPVPSTRPCGIDQGSLEHSDNKTKLMYLISKKLKTGRGYFANHVKNRDADPETSEILHTCSVPHGSLRLKFKWEFLVLINVLMTHYAV